jgi:hypothetical protein
MSDQKTNPDLLRTALVFNLVQKVVPKHVEIDTKYPEDFDLIAEVQAGRLTIINERFQHMQRKFKPEELEVFVNKKDQDGKTPLFYAW